MLKQDKKTIELDFSSLDNLAKCIKDIIQQRKELNAEATFDGGWDSGITDVVLTYQRPETPMEMDLRLKVEAQEQIDKALRIKKEKRRLEWIMRERKRRWSSSTKEFHIHEKS